jgi:hypothetical protein
VTITISEQQQQQILTVSVVFDSTALQLFPLKEDEEIFVANLKDNLEFHKFEI